MVIYSDSDDTIAAVKIKTAAVNATVANVTAAAMIAVRVTANVAVDTAMAGKTIAMTAIADVNKTAVAHSKPMQPPPNTNP